MCENPSIMSKTAQRRLDERLLMGKQTGRGELKVDGRYAYLGSKAIPIGLWQQQSLEMGLDPDIYINIVALAKNEAGNHTLNYRGRTYVVEVGDLILSSHGLRREVKSVKHYQS